MKKLLLLSLLLGLVAMLSPPVQAETSLTDVAIVNLEVDSLSVTVDVAPVLMYEPELLQVHETEMVVLASLFFATDPTERDIVVPVAQRKRMIPPLSATLTSCNQNHHSIEFWPYHCGHWMLC